VKRIKKILDSTEIDEAVVDIIREQAPNVAGALAGAAGSPVAGVVARQVASRVLGDATMSAAKVADELAVGDLTPEQRVELKRLDDEHRATMARIAADDVADARAREVATDSTFGVFMSAAAVMVIFVLLLVLPLFTENGIPESMQQTYNMGVGIVGAIATAIGQYLFGSSRGSKSKEAGLLARMR
jgi:hypothetical protein